MAEVVLHGIPCAGTTAQRPTNAPNGFCFFDTSLARPLWYDEANEVWVDATGSSVEVGVLILSGAGAPVDATTGDNIAAPGAFYIDTTNKIAYINSGTLTAPVWSCLGLQTT